MTPFLKQIALWLNSKFKDDYTDVCIIFPNRRSGLFFQKYLSEISQKVVWSPKITTISEEIKKYSGLQSADRLQLISELYKVHNIVRKSEESFDDFYYWGEMMLTDFDEADKYLVNVKQLFRNLSELKNIEATFEFFDEEQIKAIRDFWGTFKTGQESGFQKEFVDIWNSLHQIYVEFEKRLREKGIAYEGMIYRDVASKLSSNSAVKPEYKNYIVAGFNALNRCEESFFDFLKANSNLLFYWDYDNYYVSDKSREAGFFMRKNLKNFPSEAGHDNFDNFKNIKSVEFISTANKIAQTKVLNHLLQEVHKTDDSRFDDTVVVLADETLLMPVLYEIPDTIQDVNITMGYPFTNSPLFSFLVYISELQMAEMKENAFYYKAVLNLLNHQYLAGIDFKEKDTLRRQIAEGNMIYIPDEWLSGNGLLKAIFQKVEKTDSVSNYLEKIISELYKQFNIGQPEQDFRKEQEYILQLFPAIRNLSRIITAENISVSIKMYFRLLEKVMRGIRIPFEGEPLAGLQVMGVLETRLLDFRNVIVLSMNEGVMSGNKNTNSFIPYNLRKGFGLPTVDQLEAMYSYYFFRMIQRSDSVWLLYHTFAKGKPAMEMSRYMHQLKYDSDLKISERSFIMDVGVSKREEIIVGKQGWVSDVLRQYYFEEGKNSRYLSPSALNTYRDCSLKFFYTYIAGISEPQTVSEDVDALIFGNMLHASINILYENFIGKSVSSVDLEQIIKDNKRLDNVLLKVFKEHYSYSHDEIRGKNILTYEVLKKYILQLLKKDSELTPFEIISLEKPYFSTYKINITGQEISVRIGGKIDRLDRFGKELRIIDYKTGNEDLYITSFSELFNKEKPTGKKAVFQLMVYQKIVKEYFPNELVVPSVYAMKSIFDKDFDYHLKLKPSRNESFQIDSLNVSADFDDAFDELVTEIFNDKISFSQTTHPETCRNCIFKEICQR